MLAALDPSKAFSVEDSWRRENAPIERELEFDSGPAASFGSLDLRNGGIIGQTNWRSYRYQVLQLDLVQLRQSNEVAETTALEPGGSNLVNLFASLTRRKQEEIAGDVRNLIPLFGDVAARPSAHGHHRLVFQDRWRPEVWFEAHQVSDGTMLMLAYLTVLRQTTPPELLAIEEPERGLHPYLIGELVRLFRRMSRGEVGGHVTQIVLATQSAELLEFAQPEEVRVLTRTPDGGVRVDELPMASPEWDKALRAHEGSLSSLWLSGALGGVPGGP